MTSELELHGKSCPEESFTVGQEVDILRIVVVVLFKKDARVDIRAAVGKAPINCRPPLIARCADGVTRTRLAAAEA